MQVVPDLPDDMWHLILEGVDDNVGVLSARTVSHMFKEALCDTFDSLRFIRTIRREYQPRLRRSMERMGLLRFTRGTHTCTEREGCLLSTMLRLCSGTRLTAYTHDDFFVIHLTDRYILQNLIIPLYRGGLMQRS